MKTEMLFVGKPEMDPVMEVLDRERPWWTLLVEGTTYYLDVRCSLADCSYHLLLKLTAKEMRAFILIGRFYLAYLAAQVQQFPQGFYSRNQPIEVQRRAADALSRISVRQDKERQLRFYADTKFGH